MHVGTSASGRVARYRRLRIAAALVGLLVVCLVFAAQIPDRARAVRVGDLENWRVTVTTGVLAIVTSTMLVMHAARGGRRSLIAAMLVLAAMVLVELVRGNVTCSLAPMWLAPFATPPLMNGWVAVVELRSITTRYAIAGAVALELGLLHLTWLLMCL